MTTNIELIHLKIYNVVIQFFFRKVLQSTIFLKCTIYVQVQVVGLTMEGAFSCISM
jgi:esterase/lipase